MVQLVWLLLLLLPIPKLSAQSSLSEEYNGPMESWVNIVDRFGAKGDGIHDDTKSIQRAIDSLSVSTLKFNFGEKRYTVIYFPKGHYKISKSLNVRGKIGFILIGESPDDTILEWDGRNGDTILNFNGSAYYSVSRIKFTSKNGSGITGIGIHWLNRWKEKFSRSFASLNIEISDCIFENLAVGLSGGYKWNDSEVKIIRCSFDSCSDSGVKINGHNALDYWIWSSKFINCKVGVKCTRGNYHLYNCYFKGSKEVDILNNQGYYSSVRGCYSDNSNGFSHDVGSSSNPFKRVYQDNFVKNPAGIPIIYHHIGKPTFYGNKFDKNDVPDHKLDNKWIRENKIPLGKIAATLSYTGWPIAEYTILSIDNEYYYSNPFWVRSKYTKKVYTIDDAFNKRVLESPDAFLNSMPKTPKYVKRRIFEVPSNASSKIIQDIIYKAFEYRGQRPIIHFSAGEYLLDRTIVIPAGSDMKFMGDGLRYSTVIKPFKGQKFLGKSIFNVQGPSQIEIKELEIHGDKIRQIDGIEFYNIDQKESSLIADQLYSKADTSFYLDGLNYLYVEKNNSFFSDGNVLIGGELQKVGRGSFVMNSFGGQYKGVSLMNNASFISKDCWWEGDSKSPVLLKGSGNFTIDGSKMAPNNSDSSIIIKIDEFTGKVSLLNMYIQGNVGIKKENPGLNLLLWNVNFWHIKNANSLVPKNTNAKIAFVGVTSQCFYKDDPLCKLTKSYNDEFKNVNNVNQFLSTLTSQTRNAKPLINPSHSTNVSRVNLTRVFFEDMSVAIYVKGDK